MRAHLRAHARAGKYCARARAAKTRALFYDGGICFPRNRYLFGFMYIDYDGDLGTFRISKMLLSVHLPTPVAALQTRRVLANIHKKMIVKYNTNLVRFHEFLG